MRLFGVEVGVKSESTRMRGLKLQERGRRWATYINESGKGRKEQTDDGDCPAGSAKHKIDENGTTTGQVRRVCGGSVEVPSMSGEALEGSCNDPPREASTARVSPAPQLQPQPAGGTGTGAVPGTGRGTGGYGGPIISGTHLGPIRATVSLM